jgi:phosphate-selective porin OprO/OprP
MKSIHAIAVAAFALTALPNGQAEDATAAAQSLRAQIAELDQKLRILERKLEVSEEENTRKFKAIPTITANDRGIRFESPDKKYKFALRGLLQVDGRGFLDSGSGTSVEQNEFIIRRARPVLEGTLFEKLDFRFQTELAGTVRLLDAFLNYNFSDELKLQAGNFKAPVGLERLKSAAAVTFNERGFTGDFTPTRDTGVQLHGDIDKGLLLWKAGIFNGRYDGYNGAASSPGDIDDGFDFGGSLFSHPFKKTDISLLQGLGVGIAGSWGSQEGVVVPVAPNFGTNGLRYRTLGQQNTIYQIAAGNRLEGDRYRINPSLYYYNGPWGLLGEYILSGVGASNIAGGKQELKNQAWTVETSYILTGEDNSFRGIKPKNPVTFGEGGGWGAWEIAARYTGLSFDNDAFRPGAQRLATANSVGGAHSWGLGINWYLTANLKAQFSYQQTFFDDAPNRVPGTRGIGDENAFFTRLQVNF